MLIIFLIVKAQKDRYLHPNIVLASKISGNMVKFTVAYVPVGSPAGALGRRCCSRGPVAALALTWACCLAAATITACPRPGQELPLQLPGPGPLCAPCPGPEPEPHKVSNTGEMDRHQSVDTWERGRGAEGVKGRSQATHPPAATFPNTVAGGMNLKTPHH